MIVFLSCFGSSPSRVFCRFCWRAFGAIYTTRNWWKQLSLFRIGGTDWLLLCGIELHSLFSSFHRAHLPTHKHTSQPPTHFHSQTALCPSNSTVNSWLGSMFTRPVNIKPQPCGRANHTLVHSTLPVTGRKLEPVQFSAPSSISNDVYAFSPSQYIYINIYKYKYIHSGPCSSLFFIQRNHPTPRLEWDL